MKLYRITIPKRADDLSGTGSKLYGGRWNSPGHPVIYMAETISLAMLEKLVHAERASLQRTFTLCTFEVSGAVSMKEIELSNLPEEWANFPPGRDSTGIGDRWLVAHSSLILKVPSVVNPHEHNFLVNPHHPEFSAIEMKEHRNLNFDMRLK